MKAELILLNKNAEKQLVMFERQLLSHKITDLQKIEICRAEEKIGEMGSGKFINQINAFFEKMKALPEIIKSSINFSIKFRTDIQIKFNNVELTLSNNTQTSTQQQIDSLTEKINQLLEKKQNYVIIYGNGNTVVQDVKANDIKLNN